jgi:hypothetical protein
MVKKEKEKNPKATAKKTFMAVGPTLHYSHKNVQRCWFLALIVYSVCCVFWSKMVSGDFLSFSISRFFDPDFLFIGSLLAKGMSIFEYPWLIVVLGLMISIIAIVPLLISQLMSFKYSILFAAAAFFLANLHGFALSLLISCVAVACRPLRFRSRFIAIALCTAPQLLYWGYFGGAAGLEPIKWGISFTPWICGWVDVLIFAAVVLGIGHYTRYRPGLVWITSAAVLVGAIFLFEAKIGFDELDYQLYIAENNPRQISEFRDHSITKALDKTLSNPEITKYLENFFYPTEPIALRSVLKKEIQEQLAYERWPSWFLVPENLRFAEKKEQLFRRYNLFIEKRPESSRMPIALYYKALLSECSPNIKKIYSEEVLQFYYDYPRERSRNIWYRLYSQFPESGESLEARWRIALYWAGQEKFQQARELIAEALTKLEKQIQSIRTTKKMQSPSNPFRPPSNTVMTVFELNDLKMRLNKLKTLISSENYADNPESKKHLAGFVMLNPHSTDYKWHLEKLLEQSEKGAPLEDNILVAQVDLIADQHTKAQKYAQLHSEYKNTDGGMKALYELALLRIKLWRQLDDSDTEKKKEFLENARKTLTDFISLYPNSIYSAKASNNLTALATTQ